MKISNVLLTFITVRREVAKVMFLHLSVRSFCSQRGSTWVDTPQSRYSPQSRYPPRQVPNPPTLWAGTPLGAGTPPSQAGTPLGRYTPCQVHTSWQIHTPRQVHTPLRAGTPRQAGTPTPPAGTPQAGTPPAGTPPTDGYCCGRYTSYWNAFFCLCFTHYIQEYLILKQIRESRHWTECSYV